MLESIIRGLRNERTDNSDLNNMNKKYYVAPALIDIKKRVKGFLYFWGTTTRLFLLCL